MFGPAVGHDHRRRLAPAGMTPTFIATTPRREQQADATRLADLEIPRRGALRPDRDDRLGAIGRIVLGSNSFSAGSARTFSIGFLEARAQRGHRRRGREFVLGRRRRRRAASGLLVATGRRRRGRHRRTKKPTACAAAIRIRRRLRSAAGRPSGASTELRRAGARGGSTLGARAAAMSTTFSPRGRSVAIVLTRRVNSSSGSSTRALLEFRPRAAGVRILPD